MTTHNTHHEQNDVDASVVEHSITSANEATVNSAASETAEHDEKIATPVLEAIPSSSDDAAHSVSGLSSTEDTCVEQSADASSSEASAIEGNVVSQEVAGGFDAQSGEQFSDEKSIPVVEPASVQTGDVNVNETTVMTGTSDERAESGTEKEAPSFATDSAEVATSEAVSAEETATLTDSEQEETRQVSTPSAQEQAEVAARDVQAPSVQEQPLTEEFGAPTDAPAAEGAEGPVVPPLMDVDIKAEEVRPFTDIFVEFHQAEVAARGSQVEAFSILSTVSPEPPIVGSKLEVPADIVERIREAEPVDQEKSADQKPEQSVDVPEAAEQNSDEKTELPARTRPVSPLLRPASRLRLPRHGVSRHLREEQLQQPGPTAEQAASKSEVNATQDQDIQTRSEAVVEPPVVRPARRYRFDRPATSTTHGVSGIHSSAFTSGVHPPVSQPTSAAEQSTQAASQQKSDEKQTSSQARAEETKPAVNGQQNNGNGNSGQQVTESQSKKNASAQEPETPPVQQATGHGSGSKRRHSKEKEQQAATTQAQETPAVNETPGPVQQNQQEPIAPEDLPPLEYSELQKASSRRRRRHRSSPSAASTTSVANSASLNGASVPPPTPVAPTAPAPAPTPAPSPSAPPSRSLPAANENPYSIVSGYTLHQMNQGEHHSGPFLGPDPSPARGSVLVRDGRTTRAEARPMPPAYPSSRSSDATGISPAAMTQFANAISQALQQQTDRMVAEFRRLNQAPTNVSVTLPPFPSTERVGVFVDVANLLYSARTLRMTVHFGRLLDFLRGNRRLVRAHAYCPTSPQAGEEQMFLQAVKGLGYRITTKNYKTFSSGAKKADLDLDLCMDVVRLVDGGAVDCIVLVSGDSDFMPMLDYCSDHGVRVEVAAFDEAMSATLRQSCDLFINLSMLDDIRG